MSTLMMHGWQVCEQWDLVQFSDSGVSLLGEEFNNAHLDTSFALTDPKIMKLHPTEATYPRIWKLR